MENQIVVPEKVTKFAVGLVTHAETIVIVSDEINSDVTDLLTRVKMAIKDIKREKERITKPLESLKKKFIAEYKVVSEPFDTAKEILDGKQIEWARKVIAKDREEQAERDRIEDKRLQDIEDKKELLLAKGIKVNLPEPVIEEPIEEKKSVKTSGMYSTSSVRFVKKAKLVDLSKVPLDLHLFNQAKADQQIKNGVEEIPGCEIIEVGINTSRGA